MKRISLLVGGDSMIGAALAAALRRADQPVLATTRRPYCAGPDRPLLDLAADSFEVPAGTAGGVAYLCAAVARLNDCRRDPTGAARVNVAGMVALARRLVTQGTDVLFLSTNQVFDGSKPYANPEDPVSPVTEYGKQKAAAETGILALAGGPARVAVLRLSKVVAPGLPLFEDWSNTLRQGRPITPFRDMAVAPVPVDTVVAAARAVTEGGGEGIFHLSASRDVSYADLARHIARRLQADETLVRPVSYADTDALLETPALHTALQCRRLETAFGIVAPDPFATIDAVLTARPDPRSSADPRSSE